jgi:hypothetical protein
MGKFKKLDEDTPLREVLLGDDFLKNRATVDFKAWQENEIFEEDEAKLKEQYPADGGPSINVIVREFQRFVISETKLSKTQIKALALHAAGNTQEAIGRKLNLTQQAIGKAIASGQKSIGETRRQLGGPHSGLEHQALYWWRNRNTDNNQ